MFRTYSFWYCFWCLWTVVVCAQNTPSSPAQFDSNPSLAVVDTLSIDTVADPTAHINPYYEPIVVPSLPQPLYHLYLLQAIYESTKNAPPQDSLSQLIFITNLDSLQQRIECDEYYYGMQYIGNDLQPPRSDGFPYTTLFYLLLLIMVVFTIMRQWSDSYLERTFVSIGNFNLARQFFEEHTSPRNQVFNILVGFNWVLLLSVIFFLLLHYWAVPLPFSDLALLGILFLAIGVYYTYRQLLLQVVAFVLLPLSDLVRFYRFTLTAINTLLVMALFPFVCVFAFTNNNLIQQYTLYVAAIIFVTIVLYAITRFWLIAKDVFWQYQLHFWIYCCTFELAPLLIIYKYSQQSW